MAECLILYADTSVSAAVVSYARLSQSHHMVQSVPFAIYDGHAMTARINNSGISLLPQKVATCCRIKHFYLCYRRSTKITKYIIFRKFSQHNLKVIIFMITIKHNLYVSILSVVHLNDTCDK